MNTLVRLVLSLNFAVLILANVYDDVREVKRLLQQELLSNDISRVLEKLDEDEYSLGHGIKSEAETPKSELMKKDSRAEDSSTVKDTVEKKNGFVESCFDMLDTRKCKKLINDERFEQDCKNGGLYLVCRKTCGKCAVTKDIVPECITSEFGCCESEHSIAKNDSMGTNCPVCKDKHPELCEKYKRDCNTVGYERDWMMENCYKTCEICTNCANDEEFETDCPFWKKEGLCLQLPSLMGKHCKKSCQQELQITC